jgi:chromosome segregation ATPase
VKPRPVSFALVAVVLAARFAPLAAQDSAQAAPAPDTSTQGYAPAPAPAPAAVPYTPPTAAAARADRAASLGFINVLPVRSTERIRNELEAARFAEREADARLSEAGTQREQTKAMVQVKKQEVSTASARIKLAEKQKQESEKATLEAEKKVNQRQQQFLERREALHGAEIDQAKAAKKLSQAQRNALEVELQLAQRREERVRVAAADPAATDRNDAIIRELERKTLEAQQQRADAARDLADRDQDIAKRRLELYRAQMAAGGR